MTGPKRIQLSRKRGWRKPDGAVVVSRPSKWGNPWTLADAREHIGPAPDPVLRGWCVLRFTETLDVCLLCDNGIDLGAYADLDEMIRGELGGRDLACWCPLDQPCHADVLLELANGPEL